MDDGSSIKPFLLAIWQHLSTLLTGGTVMALVALTEWKTKKKINWWIYRLVFWGFLFMAFSQAWEDQSLKRIASENESAYYKQESAYRQKRIDFLSDAHLKTSATNKVQPEIIAAYNKQSPVVQGNQASNLTVNTDYSVKNSPPITQTATTIVQSFGQQGGITAQTVIVTNSAGAVFKASVEISIDEQNKPQDGKYITSGTVHLVSPYPVGKLYIIAHGKSIINRPMMDGFSVSPKGGGISMQSWGRQDDASYAILLNAFGDYDLKVTTTNQEQLKFEWNVK
jgi:hypothetical protein